MRTYTKGRPPAPDPSGSMGGGSAPLRQLLPRQLDDGKGSVSENAMPATSPPRLGLESAKGGFATVMNR